MVCGLLMKKDEGRGHDEKENLPACRAFVSRRFFDILPCELV